MNVHGSFARSGMTWQDRVSIAKANPDLASVLLSIVLNEADRHGDSEVVEATQYALDTGDYSELDAIFEEEERFERTLHAASYYPGNELPDDVFFAITGEAA